MSHYAKDKGKTRVSSGVVVETRPKKRKDEPTPNTVRKPESGNGGFKPATGGFKARGGRGFAK